MTDEDVKAVAVALSKIAGTLDQARVETISNAVTAIVNDIYAKRIGPAVDEIRGMRATLTRLEKTHTDHETLTVLQRRVQRLEEICGGDPEEVAEILREERAFWAKQK